LTQVVIRRIGFGIPRWIFRLYTSDNRVLAFPLVTACSQSTQPPLAFYRVATNVASATLTPGTLKGKSPLAGKETRDATKIDARGLGDRLSVHAAGVDDFPKLIADGPGADYWSLRHNVTPEEVERRVVRSPAKRVDIPAAIALCVT
jgi:hypothetical protein